MPSRARPAAPPDGSDRANRWRFRGRFAASSRHAPDGDAKRPGIGIGLARGRDRRPGGERTQHAGEAAKPFLMAGGRLVRQEDPSRIEGRDRVAQRLVGGRSITEGHRRQPDLPVGAGGIQVAGRWCLERVLPIDSNRRAA